MPGCDQTGDQTSKQEHMLGAWLCGGYGSVERMERRYGSAERMETEEANSSMETGRIDVNEKRPQSPSVRARRFTARETNVMGI